MSHLYRGFVQYDKLNGIYAQSRLVIDDANHQTKDWGAENSRVFDALAAGCLVITNLIRYFTAQPKNYESLQSKLRSLVLKQHLYRHRALVLKLKLENVT